MRGVRTSSRREAIVFASSKSETEMEDDFF